MKIWIFASGMTLALATGSSAVGAELPSVFPTKAWPAPAIYNWTGLYIGAHAGYSRGSSSAVLTDPAPATTSNAFGGMVGGVQAGYNYQLPSGMVLGVEADITFPNYLTSNSVVSSLATARSDVTEQWDYVATARGRVGYAAGSWLFYATGGLAFVGERFLDPRAISNSDAPD